VLKKLWFTTANIAFWLFWFSLVIRLARRWKMLSGDAHFWVTGLAVEFVLLWLYLLRERSSTMSVALTGFAVLAASRASLP
jgi:hypothetical protein